MVEFLQLGGALGRPPAIPNPMGTRNAAYSLVCRMIALPGSDLHISKIRDRLFEGMQPWDTGNVLPSFLGTELSASDQLKRTYRTAACKKLTSIKKTCYPMDLFQINHNILLSP
jgi:hypothetical protein